MAWTYRQSTGELAKADGEIVSIGYSGHGEGLNNPAFQTVPDVGPIPQGDYEIGPPVDTVEHGPYCLPLTPLAGTDEFGRSAFMCHGDEIEHPGEHLASLGCVIQPRSSRVQMWAGGDHILQVIE